MFEKDAKSLRGFISCVLLLLAAISFGIASEPGETDPQMRFEVTVAKGLVDEPHDGRMYIVIGREGKTEPRHRIGQTEKSAPPVLGEDVNGLTENSITILDQVSAIYPIDLSKLPPGKYQVQAVFHKNRDLNLPGAPGNLTSDPMVVTLDPAKGGTVRLQLTRKLPEERLPADTEHVKYLKVKSELLSEFHKRPIYLRVGVILPRDFDKEKDRTYPLWVRIGGYGTRYTAAGSLMSKGARFRQLWLADETPRMILLHLDGAGPYGDPYQVNSANNGPYGDAVTQELIPLVEKKFRGIGQAHARVLDGHSTGGWVSLALQIFYPEFFNGCWSTAPDPVDFRAYETLDIYSDDNAYVDKKGGERPASRDSNGKTITTVRGECQMESVLGRGNRWELSGKDWCAWNATFGPRGEDGLPTPIWNGKTGKIDRGVVAHWKKYDLRAVLEKDWPALAPKLKGKIRIWVGEADDYFLNAAVHLLDDFLSKAKPAYEGRIVFGAGRDHGWRGLTDRQLMEEMAAAIKK